MLVRWRPQSTLGAGALRVTAWELQGCQGIVTMFYTGAVPGIAVRTTMCTMPHWLGT